MGDRHWTISGRDVVLGWMEQESDPNIRKRVLDHLAIIGADPLAFEAIRRPGMPPAYFVLVPDTDVVITYLVVDQYTAIMVQRIERLPDGLIEGDDDSPPQLPGTEAPER